MAVPYFPLEIETDGSEAGETTHSEGENVEDLEFELQRDVQPYMFEPETDESDENDDQDEASGNDVMQASRLENLDWCECGNCVVMPTARECRCCREIPEVTAVMEEENADCITTHPGFHGVCQDVWGLQTAYFGYRQQYGAEARERTLPEKYRHTAYRQLVRFCWHYLGKDIRVVLPACSVSKIRETFPSEAYEGFKLPRL